ncbi:MAG: plasmid stabilization system protein ParE [Ulvibacter sp.]|jgi:toxin YoeB
MARKIIWSRRAQNDRIGIFTYWNKRNKSKVYSRKLNSLYNQAAKFVATNPNAGSTTTRENIRVKFVSHFALIYKVTQFEIQMLSIFDSRQSPEKLEEILGE